MQDHMMQLLKEMAIKGSCYLVYATLIALIIIKFVAYVFG